MEVPTILLRSEVKSIHATKLKKIRTLLATLKPNRVAKLTVHSL